ncbi:MAG: hypothetical protein IPP42_02795 [Saprospiraceae bacterium]|nr:hypothetical protein [Saprospiraceae bacterium]
MGRYKTHHLSPEVIADWFKKKQEGYIRAVCRSERIPIDPDLSLVGSINAVLKIIRD